MRRRRKNLSDTAVLLTLNIVRAVMLSLTAVMLILIILVTLATSDGGLLGRRAFSVNDELMTPKLKGGDLVIAEPRSSYRSGDTVVYISSAVSDYGSHHIRTIRESTTHKGHPAYTVFPTANGIDELAPAYEVDVVGEVTAKIGGAGEFVEFVKSPGGYMLLVVLPFVLLIVGEILRQNLLRR